MSALRVRGLGKTFAGGTEALRGVDVHVNQGEIVAIPGGCGKTTLLRLIAGRDQAGSGRARGFAPGSESRFGSLRSAGSPRGTASCAAALMRVV